MSAEILRVHPDEPQPDRIDYIVSCLRQGDVVAMPTDTFYGLAVDPVNLHAVENIYRIKSRQKQKPLSLLIASLAQAYELARDSDPMLDGSARAGGAGGSRLGADRGRSVGGRLAFDGALGALRWSWLLLRRSGIRGSGGHRATARLRTGHCCRCSEPRRDGSVNCGCTFHFREDRR